MKVDCFRITDAGRIETFNFENFNPAWGRDGVNQWVDAEEISAEQGSELLRDFNLHGLIMENIEDAASGTRVLAFESSLYMNLPLPREKWDQLTPVYLTFICLPNLLVTLHEQPIPQIDEIKNDLQEGEIELNQNSPAALVYTILDQVVDSIAAKALDLREKVNQMGQLLDYDPQECELHDILKLKRRCVHLLGACEGQVYCIHALLASQTQSFSLQGLREYYRDISGQIEYIFRILNRVESRLDDQHQHFQLMLQDRSSRRLNTLSIIAGIFLPVTLIAGIYGMNFEVMPELGLPWGYPAALGLMLLIGAGMLIYFKVKGWFD